MRDPIRLSAKALAHGIRSGAFSAAEVVDAHIERIREVNPSINAVVATRYEAARAEAAETDRRVKASPPESLPPLCGVPITVKEFVAVRGMPHTGGVLGRAQEVASADAPAVARLRQAGAIVLGVTNAPEGGLWHETSNPVYGRTHNPHDLYRTSGGSSGGEGAVLAAGGAPMGLGSDAGGSVRIPAAFCGIVGHKPSVGLVPDEGHFPPRQDAEIPALVLGPMARHVDDLELMLDVLAGAARATPRTPVHTRDLVVHVEPAPGRTRPTPEIRAAVEKSARALEECGAQRQEWSGPDLSEVFEIWAAVLSDTATRYDELLHGPRGRRALLGQVARWWLGRSRHSGGAISTMLLERVVKRLPARTRRLVSAAAALRAGVERALGPRGLLLLPVYPRTALRHRAIALRRPSDLVCTTLFNLTGGPATAVRVDTDPRGLPVGVQVGASRGGDDRCLHAARVLQDTFGAPAPIEPRWGRPAPFGVRLG